MSHDSGDFQDFRMFRHKQGAVAESFVIELLQKIFPVFQCPVFLITAVAPHIEPDLPGFPSEFFPAEDRDRLAGGSTRFQFQSSCDFFPEIAEKNGLSGELPLFDLRSPLIELNGGGRR